MQPKFLYLTMFIYLFSGNLAFAEHNKQATIDTKVYLESIIAKKPATNNDQLYLQLTEYSNTSKAKEYRIPTYPKHWLLKDLAKLKNIILWDNKVQDLEHKELIISLVENDNPPLDSDEPLGSIKLVLSNHNGNLKSIWDKTSFKEPIQIQKITEKPGTHHVTFKMQGKNSEYIISFYVKIKY